jgi:hypothetical protein
MLPILIVVGKEAILGFEVLPEHFFGSVLAWLGRRNMLLAVKFPSSARRLCNLRRATFESQAVEHSAGATAVCVTG